MAYVLFRASASDHVFLFVLASTTWLLFCSSIINTFFSPFPASTTWMASTSWCLFCCSVVVSVFVNNIAFVCSGMNNIAFACSGNLEKNQIENLDRTSVTSLVWHDSVKKGEERLRDFERLSQSSHARVTSVKSKQGQGVNE